MWEPHCVSTDATYSGAVGSEMSKTLMPSHESLIAALWATFSHESLLREESVLRTSRSP